MTANISPFPINGNIIAPPSKSVAMRYILLAALCSGETIIENTGNSEDVQTAIKCINALGAKIESRVRFRRMRIFVAFGFTRGTRARHRIPLYYGRQSAEQTFETSFRLSEIDFIGE